MLVGIVRQLLKIDCASKLLSSDCKGDIACQNQNKLLFESTLMSGIKSVLAQNPFQEEKPNSLIGSIKEN